MPGETGFSLGFFCGAILGAIGVYMITTPEGKNLKKVIMTEFEKHQQAYILESITPIDDKTPTSDSIIINTIHSFIKKTKEYTRDKIATSTSKGPIKPSSQKKKHIFKKK